MLIDVIPVKPVARAGQVVGTPFCDNGQHSTRERVLFDATCPTGMVKITDMVTRSRPRRLAYLAVPSPPPQRGPTGDGCCYPEGRRAQAAGAMTLGNSEGARKRFIDNAIAGACVKITQATLLCTFRKELPASLGFLFRLRNDNRARAQDGPQN